MKKWLLVLGLLLSSWASAAPTYSISVGRLATGLAEPTCVALTAFFASSGMGVISCTVPVLVVGAFVEFSDGEGGSSSLSVDAVTLVPDAAPPPGPVASAPVLPAGTTDAAKLLDVALAGFLVLAFGLGYIGGYSQ